MYIDYIVYVRYVFQSVSDYETHTLRLRGLGLEMFDNSVMFSSGLAGRGASPQNAANMKALQIFKNGQYWLVMLSNTC